MRSSAVLEYSLSPVAINVIMGVAANVEKKEMKQNHEYLCTHSWKDGMKPQFFLDGMIMYVEILKQPTEP